MTRRLLISIAATLAVAFCAVAWAWAIVGVASALAADQSTWRDTPPREYRGTGTATVFYLHRQDIQRMCGMREAVACTRGSSVFMPVQCSPSGQPVTQTETVNVVEEMRDTGYCASVRAHEFGHVNGWRH